MRRVATVLHTSDFLLCAWWANLGAMPPFARVLAAAVLASALASTAAHAQAARGDITFADGRIFPESLTSTRDGAVYVGSLGHNSVYRTAPGSSRAEVWIPPGPGLQRVLGVFADEAAGVLWVCSSVPADAPAGAGASPTALEAYGLTDAKPRASYAFPGGTGTCNDIAVSRDGIVYATDTSGGRLLRLGKNAPSFEVWLEDTAALTGVDGIAILGDGQVYVNNVRQSTLLRVPVRADGSAGPIQKLTTSRPISGPDGMRSVGGQTLLLVEGGRLDEVVVSGQTADVRVLREGMAGPTAVTLVGDVAYVIESRLNLRTDPTDPGPFRAVAVPYRASR